MTASSSISDNEPRTFNVSQVDGGCYLVLVDESAEFKFVLRAAAKLAEANNGHVAILSVLEKQKFQPWGGVEERMREEQRRGVEQNLQDIALCLEKLGTSKPSFYIYEGQERDAIKSIIEDNHNIQMLILGDGKGTVNPLVHYFIEGGLHELQVPMLVVPGAGELT